MDSRVDQLCTELAIYGEHYIRFFVNKYDGTVKIRFIDPSIIDQVDTDPDDIEKHLRYHRRPIGPSPTQTMDPVANVLDRGAMGTAQKSAQSSIGVSTYDPTMMGEWFTAGTEVIQIKINAVSNAKRGKSDLATLLPWLRRYKDWLTDRVRINKYKGAFLWDVALKGADAKTVARKKMDYSYPPEPGTVLIHNEAEQWTAVQPQINANEAAEDGRQIKLMVAVGALLPEHYLSDGSVATRATAAEMGLPTLLKFQRRQRILNNALHLVLDRVIEEARKAGKLSGSIDANYDLIFPEIDVADNQSMATAFASMVPALAGAKGQGWMSDETAMELMFKCLNEEIDVHDELARIAQMPSPTHEKPPESTAQTLHVPGQGNEPLYGVSTDERTPTSVVGGKRA